MDNEVLVQLVPTLGSTISILKILCVYLSIKINTLSKPSKVIH